VGAEEEFVRKFSENMKQEEEETEGGCSLHHVSINFELIDGLLAISVNRF
jgi:hypothetical protein